MRKYANNAAYYTYNERPMSSTFKRGSMTFGQFDVNTEWQTQYKDVLKTAGIDAFFIPTYDDAILGSTFFDRMPVADGLMCWECAWPGESPSSELQKVSTDIDQTYLNAAKNAKKTYMIALSALQFKHMKIDSNWYRAGENNLSLRIEQALKAQPDFVEVLT